ncbi:hypothetical protein HQ489_02025 [Candidatus Woesearchaeota archaeon]|nr:hypothetical protein [Candidatus Woesearchaeota archaeon]
MTSSPLFEWLVMYHLEKNLSPRSEYLSHGDMPFAPEGEEVEGSFGCLIIENGDTLAERLREERIILDRRHPQFKPANDYDEFQDYLVKNGKKDGAFIYDSLNQRVARVNRLSNNTPQMDEVRGYQTNLIPNDFIFDGRTQTLIERDIDDHVGTKTDLAIVIPEAYTTDDSHVQAYQIKRTAYGNLGLGKVTHFAKGGLQREFFFDYIPTGDNKSELMGVYRTYHQEDGKVQLLAERKVPLSYISKESLEQIFAEEILRDAA